MSPIVRRFNIARMEYPALDGAVLFFKSLIVVIVGALAVRALTGCGGAPFLASDEVGLHDAGPESSGGDARVIEGGDEAKAEAEAEAGVEAESGTPPPDAGDAGACCESPTPACSTPLASCPVTAINENHGSFPTSFEMYATPAENCTTETTPAACLCDYTCACVTAHWTCPNGSAPTSCTNDPLQGLLVSCNN